MSEAAGSGALWYVPAAMPLGSRMGLGVDTRPFLVQRLEGNVEVARDGARDVTLDTGADAYVWSDSWRAAAGGLDGRGLCLSVSKEAVPTWHSRVTQLSSW